LRSLYGFWITILGFLREVEAFYSEILNNEVTNEIQNFIKGYENRDKLLKAGIDDSFTLLLYGPPGCGKTSIAQYISMEIGLPLVTVRLDGMISSLLGSTAKNIRKI